MTQSNDKDSFLNLYDAQFTKYNLQDGTTITMIRDPYEYTWNTCSKDELQKAGFLVPEMNYIPWIDPHLSIKKNKKEMNKQKVVFMCLVGTLIENVKFNGEEVTYNFKEGVLPFLKAQFKDGFKFIIVSNQLDVEMGNILPVQLQNLIRDVRANIELYVSEKTDRYYSGIVDKAFIGSYIADSKNSSLRKPFPTAAVLAEKELNVDISKSAMLGDGDTDKAFAFNSQIPFYIDVAQLVQKKDENSVEDAEVINDSNG